MNLYIKALILSLLLVAPLLASSQVFEEGTHYSRIENFVAKRADEVRDEADVVEYFSFSCPGCFAAEPMIEELVKAEPDIDLRQVHIPYGGRNAKFSQKAFVLMTLLGANQYKEAIFNRIHVERNVFDNEEEVIEFFESLGYARSTLETTLRSFTADTLVRKMNQEAIKNKIRSVPTIIVNKKFKVNLGAVTNGSSMAALIRYLHSLP